MNYYDTIAPGYNKLYKQEQLSKLQLVQKHIHGSILDLGAGTCIIAEHFTNVTSVDPSIGMLQQGTGKRLCATAEALPFVDNTFDTVISLTSLHHTHLQQALQEIQRVVKEKGTIIISMLKQATYDTLLFKDFQIIEHDKDLIYLKLNQTC